MRLITIILFYIFIANGCFAQELFPIGGITDKRPSCYAFIHATIQVDPDTRLEDASLIIQEGKIISVGKGVSIPSQAIVVDLNGYYIYPSFIDLDGSLGITKPSYTSSSTPQYQTEKKGAYYWNQAIQPERNATDFFKYDDKQAEEYRKNGFGTLLTHINEGIARGTGSVVYLADVTNQLLIPKASTHFSFNKGNSKQEYPKSLMGSVALLRQLYYDVDWYKKQVPVKEINLSLEAMSSNASLPMFFEANDKAHILRLHTVAKEFNQRYIVKAGGNEYQQIAAIKNTSFPLIVPLSFQSAYDVSNPFEASWVSLKNMRHWEMSPSNPAAIFKAGIPFCITSSNLEDKSTFLKQVQKAILFGLPEKEALRALTTTPASLLNIDKYVGSLSIGKTANFIISSAPIFSKNVILFENWVAGKQHIINQRPYKDVRGYYTAEMGGFKQIKLEITGTLTAPEATIKIDTSKTVIKANVSLIKDELMILFKRPDTKTNYRLSGRLATNPTGKPSWGGKALDDTETWMNWKATLDSVYKQTSKDSVESIQFVSNQTFPTAAFGRAKYPNQQRVLFKNATLWTGEKEGIFQSDILIDGGKIIKIGKNISDPSATQVDATGKHITAGIVDEHAHIALTGGVNEASNSVTSEVRLSDALYPEDPSIYRQLAGGVTTCQLLHGSANCIGGQSAIIKMRWGLSSEGLLFEEAPKFIKFALGENVKQSNWGESYRIRFPQTRMGVEQVFEDAFSQAKAYRTEWNTFKSSGSKINPPRKDLRLESILEVLDSKRFVTCHSYVQSEVLMLMNVAERHMFRINTFTHILEGYKIADKLKKHGASASTFADWWAYKFEVKDAIPYNAALLHKTGVLTGLNSDYPDPGRRLNLDAAKIIKFGGLSEEEAWNLITLNPAKMLHIDHRVGSLAIGKDADIVVWSANPLTVYAQVLQTWVDGRKLFDIQENDEMLVRQQKERALLVQKMMEAKAKGDKTIPPAPPKSHWYDCEDLEE